jgi:hypothetical protein
MSAGNTAIQSAISPHAAARRVPETRSPTGQVDIFKQVSDLLDVICKTSETAMLN